MQDRLKYYKAKLSDHDFQKVSEFIEKNYGIKLPRPKKAMVQNRLYKRLIETEMPTFEEYIAFVFSKNGMAEVSKMVDEITTNKTEFFRERKHYDFLEANILKNVNNLKIWSAGCSSGEEPYTLAMLLKEYNVTYTILGTDLSGKILDTAKKGIYSENTVKDVPIHLLKKHFTKKENMYQINNDLKSNIRFSKLNFMDANYGINTHFDIIFFRNVLIYFTIETQLKIIKKIIQNLKEGGYLFIGHSETIYSKEFPLVNVSHAVYQKKTNLKNNKV